MAELLIDAFLRDAGFVTDASRAAARRALEEAGVTNPRKKAMAVEKLARARAALEQRILRLCGDDRCRELTAGDGRQPVEVDRSACAVCGGSNNRRALRAMVAACRRSGVRRLLVVGGTSSQDVEMREHLGGAELEVRFVSGLQKLPNRAAAERDCAWADCVVVWAPSPLPHKVSDLYGRDVCVAPRNVTVHRRGIEGLADEVSRHLGR